MTEFYERLVLRFAATRIGAWFIVNIGTKIDRHIIRWTGGRFSSASGTNIQVVLLFVTGAKSGIERCVPLTATFNGEDIILIGSRGGNVRNPGWYHNLKANPHCSVEHAGTRTERIAYEAAGEERELFWQLAVETYQGYAAYKLRTERTIPIMVLKLA